jgi:hypothetical protein
MAFMMAAVAASVAFRPGLRCTPEKPSGYSSLIKLHGNGHDRALETTVVNGANLVERRPSMKRG